MLRVGDRVRLSAEGIRVWNLYREERRSNPVDVEGVIVAIQPSMRGRLPYRVQWPVARNCYREEHLEITSLEDSIDAWLEDNP